MLLCLCFFIFFLMSRILINKFVDSSFFHHMRLYLVLEYVIHCVCMRTTDMADLFVWLNVSLPCCLTKIMLNTFLFSMYEAICSVLFGSNCFWIIFMCFSPETILNLRFTHLTFVVAEMYFVLSENIFEFIKHHIIIFLWIFILYPILCILHNKLRPKEIQFYCIKLIPIYKHVTYFFMSFTCLFFFVNEIILV